MATDDSYRNDEEEREFEEGLGEDFDREDPEFVIEFDEVSDSSSESVPSGEPEEDEIFGIFDEEDEDDGSFTLDSEEEAEEFAFLLEEEDEDEFFGPGGSAEGEPSSMGTDRDLEFIWEDGDSEPEASVVFNEEESENQDLTGLEEIIEEGPAPAPQGFDQEEDEEFSFEIEEGSGEVSFSSSFIASEDDGSDTEDVRELEEEIFGMVDQNSLPEEKEGGGTSSTLSEEEDYLFDSELGTETGMTPEEMGGLFNEEGEPDPDLASFSQEDLGQESSEEEIFGEEIASEESAGEVFDPEEPSQEDFAGEEEVQESRFGIPTAQDAARWGDPSIFGGSPEASREDSEESAVGGAPFGSENFMQESGSFQIPSGEFELVEDPRDLQSGVYSRSEGLSEGGEGQEEEWDEEAEFDPIYGKQDEGAAEEDFCTDEEPDYSDLEAIAPEDEHFFAEEPGVIGGYQGSPARRKLLALGMAASILVLLSVGVLIWNPDFKVVKDFRKMLGMNRGARGHKMVEVTKVDRPKIPLVLPSGRVVSEGPVRIAKGPGPFKRDGNSHKSSGRPPRVGGALVQGGRTPRMGTRISKGLRKGMSDGAMGLGRFFSLIGEGLRKSTQDSIERARREGSLPVPSRVENPTRPRIAKGPEPKPIKPITKVETLPNQPKAGPGGGGAGSGGAVSEGPGERVEKVETPVAPKAAYFDTKALRRGIQALAQLRNGNFFVGRVYKVKPSEIVLSLKHGEVAFIPDDLKKIVPLVDSEAKLLRGKEIGIVRLRNRNKLVGKILAESPDFIAVETDEKSKIFLPRTSILEVERKKPTPIAFGKDEDWSPEALLPLPEPEGEGGDGLPALPVVEKEEGDGPAIQVQIDEPVKKGEAAEPGK